MTVVVANDSRLIITKKYQSKMEKLTEIIQTLWKDEMISSHAYAELLNFTNTHQDLQLLKSRVSDSSLKIILECLNSSLKYGKELMINADENDVNLGLELWRKNEAISLAISDEENYH